MTELRSRLEPLARKAGLSFGDNVRVQRIPVTEAAGVAGMAGQIFGFTTPSATHIEVIGEVTDDFAVNVHMAERKEAFWFAANLLEFVDHGPGTEITLQGVAKKWARRETGEWEERPQAPSTGGILRRALRKLGWAK
jgi:hypothetical protein